MIKNPTTTTAKIMLIITSVFAIDKILPNKNDVTSVFKPEVIEVIKIPSAIELVEIKATEESPFMFEFELTRKSKNADKTVIGIEIIKGEAFKAIAIAIEPKATWDNPSPIIEYRFRTSGTPSRAEQIAIKEPATSA